jgi:hypothetical protein
MLHDKGPAWHRAGDLHLTHATRLRELRGFIGCGSGVDAMLRAGRFHKVLVPDLGVAVAGLLKGPGQGLEHEK